MAAPTAPIYGFQGYIYYNTATYGSPTWVAISNVGDLKVTVERNEKDIEVRSQGGWAVTAIGLKKGSWEFQMVYDPADTKQAALQTAFDNGAAIECLILDQANGTSGSAGIRASFVVTKFARQEEINGAMMVDVVLKPAYSANAPARYTAA